MPELKFRPTAAARSGADSDMYSVAIWITTGSMSTACDPHNALSLLSQRNHCAILQGLKFVRISTQLPFFPQGEDSTLSLRRMHCQLHTSLERQHCQLHISLERQHSQLHISLESERSQKSQTNPSNFTSGIDHMSLQADT
jgi:hypothetical protein